MGKYNKFWVALLGAAAVGASSAGYISPEGSELAVNSVISFLTAIGVWGVPNSG